MTKIKRKPIEKRPLYREEIGNAIRDAIVSGDLKPGDRIVETQWAKDLGVSQSPVREAIRELEMIGLVENIPYQGCFVRKITKQDMKDAYRVRMYLEMLGIQDAVESATEAQLKEIYQILEEMEAEAKKSAFNSYTKKNEQFHEKIIEISQNKLLIRLWKQSHIQDSTFFGTQLSEQTLEALAVRHKDLYDAIAARDEKRAKEAIYQHFQELIEELDKKA
ncbi:GntR family transcriptional regulator [Sinanaerobacter chloroacetimidivorans]|jgi:DNA-binding GntR family transcriptional regulator|uniref:GntR family transcriptional regulator n=1 Tax=Sinanaerobacter chloroacetimidivorans TaxID=2818044 RepID=A0A8J7W2N9_9FIRM|nr:GntR family transcriptional regulator [Sinanaerobacter chloroacetimidivorans]MBR0599271.1 GntR family transcriptional regulator [Sinanaerobacter chloroacetimidivorans]